MIDIIIKEKLNNIDNLLSKHDNLFISYETFRDLYKNNREGLIKLLKSGIKIEKFKYNNQIPFRDIYRFIEVTNIINSYYLYNINKNPSSFFIENDDLELLLIYDDDIDLNETLLEASINNSLNIIKYLIANNVNIDYKRENGWDSFDICYYL